MPQDVKNIAFFCTINNSSIKIELSSNTSKKTVLIASRMNIVFKLQFSVLYQSSKKVGQSLKTIFNQTRQAESSR